MLSFDYRQAMDLDDLPLMDAAELRDRLTGAVAEGWRVLAFFGLPEAARGLPVLQRFCQKAAPYPDRWRG